MEKENEIIVSRVFDAPIAMVYEAWSNAEFVKKWWAPKNCTTTYCSIDFRIGGIFRFCMTTAEGMDCWGRGIYKKINPPHTIVYEDCFTDKDGTPVAPSYYGLQLTTIKSSTIEVQFEEVVEKTKVTIRYMDVAEVGAEIEMAKQGWNDMLEKLSVILIN